MIHPAARIDISGNVLAEFSDVWLCEDFFDLPEDVLRQVFNVGWWAEVEA